MPVNTENPQYRLYTSRWKTVRDCVAGDETVKAEGKRYVPQFIPHEPTRYAQYLQRAIFVNFTGRTKASLVGAAFRKAPEVIDLPPAVQELVDNFDGKGQSVEQVSRSVVSNVSELGRHGLLVDYPRAEGGLSLEDVAEQGLRPTTREYTAENIINWRTNGNRLVLVVLREYVEDSSNIFTFTQKAVYRVLTLDAEGNYTQAVVDIDGNIELAVNPTRSDGTFWKEIPFLFVGSVNNTPDIDPPPLYDMAVVNIGHFRNSADYEEGVHISGQPMPHIDVGTTSADEWTKLNPNGIQVGARRGIVTSGGGTAQLLQAAANGAAYEAMRSKEEQLVQIGARLVTRGGNNETAEAVRANTASENSVLGNIVENTQDAIVRCLQWMAEFSGVTGDINIEFNTQFFDREPDAQVIAQFIGLRAIGLVSGEEVRGYLRNTNAIPDMQDDEIALGNIEDEGP